MVIFYMVFAFIVLLIFNTLTNAFCIKMELSQKKQLKVYRVINMIMVALLVCSYLRVLNVTV
ncbi:hypothetical protein AQ616_11045 [Oceanobacillus sp. E9]|uniref:Uncharacterized protein n=1 Tax=Oceanobacillus kimchii TaxID=746691 RepID=A0ABQ5TIS3_9BACI|nr:hypothetical protein AQ616_11045 [Oceanobacillus sp. E9]GLO65594.1 hypothetical protein MACH08_13780 [Oceanobacillus kimchii]